MNKQELIKRIEVLPYTEGPIADTITINRNWILESIEQLDEPEMGHADEAPRYVKNILARLRELPLHDREVWLKAIVDEFEKDFSHAKWREGYEQGKFEGMVEREKVTIPQFEKDKLYIVKIKNLDSDVRVLKKRNRWYFGGDWDDERDIGLKIHTRKELEEAGFGWVFDCPGIEIEEVE